MEMGMRMMGGTKIRIDFVDVVAVINRWWLLLLLECCFCFASSCSSVSICTPTPSSMPHPQHCLGPPFGA